MIDHLVPIAVEAITEIASNPAVVTVSLYQTYNTTFEGVADIIVGIKERFNERKFDKFFEALKAGNLAHDAIAKYIGKTQKREERFESVVEQIVIRIDRLDAEYKAEWQAMLLIALLEGEIDYTIFCDMLAIIEQWMQSDNEQLLCLYDKAYPGFISADVSDSFKSALRMDRCGRLVGLGVAQTQSIWGDFPKYHITWHGRTLAELILYNKVDTEHKSNETSESLFRTLEEGEERQ